MLSKIPSIRRIKKEDYDSEHHDLIEKLGFSLNSFMDDVIALFNGNIDFTNLKQEITTVDVKIDNSGQLAITPKIKSKLSSKVQGILVVNAINKNNSTIFPSNSPFISFSFDKNGLVQIDNITGLQANSEYKLTVILIG